MKCMRSLRARMLCCLVGLCALVGAHLLRGAPAGPASAPATSPAVNPAVNPAVIPTPRDGRWLARHEEYVEQAKRGGVDVLFLGDSIIDAWRGPGRRVWQEHFAPLNAANFGMSADRTEHVLWRIQNGELEGIRPKLVVVLIGTNNLKSGPVAQSPQETVEGVAAVVTEIRTRLPETKVLVMGIFPRQPQYEWIAGAIRDTNALLSGLEGGAVRFMDIYDKLLGPNKTVTRDIMGSDLLHPTEKGYRIWAESIIGVVKDAVAAK